METNENSTNRALRAARTVPAEPAETTTVTATEAKNEFGRVLDTVARGGIVVVTKHHAPKAVVLSIDQFNALSMAGELRLDALSRQFDDLLERMQTPEASAGMQAAFEASPSRLGEAAVTAARRRG